MDCVITIPARGDNFMYLYPCGQAKAVAVDPADSSAVLDLLQTRELKLAMILVTHHHWDHTAGVAELKKRGCEVVGADGQRIPGLDRVASDKQILTVGDMEIHVIATPGHTTTSLCYYVPATNDEGCGILWTGDTMFTGGCGRVLECDARTMWNSLLKLSLLPDHTLVYCGHDYAEEDYEFTLSIEPDNEAVRQRLDEIRQATAAGAHTVPSTMLAERTTNPFLRADTPQLQAALKMPHAKAVEVFAELRRRKDFF
ncbi:MAG TPA: hydroxyacylglutathione hydrolase [Sedimentisphaerales bacterium]|nr:hydroxyacylglutathione hydrolase [Sedimentisphaerales bacterium]